MEWRDLRTALAVGQHGSLRRAGRALGVDATTVSRRVSALEKDLGVTLFTRNPRSWRLTAAGQVVLDRCERMAEEARAIRHDADRVSGRVAGKVRITGVDAVVATYVIPELHRLYAEHPDLKVEFLITNAYVDLVRGKADIALRHSPPAQAGLIAKKMVLWDVVIAGTPEVVALPRAQRPVLLLGLLDTENPWNRAARSAGGPLVGAANSHLVLLEMLRAGLGVGVISRDVAEREGLAVVDIDVVPQPMWRAVPEDIADAPRVRAVTDFLDDVFSA